MRKPDLIIGPANAPQTLRWDIIRWRGRQLALHKWLRSDDDRALHDHSADNVSIILNEGYMEVLAGDERRFRWPLVPYFRRAEVPHRIELLSARPVWSLWFRFPPRREWGFHCVRGWRHWRDYVANRADYSTPSSVSEVGPGCD